MSAPEHRLPGSGGSSYSVYVLALEDGCYYVGKSKRVHPRIRAHFRGKGSEWTKEHEPVEVVLTEKVGTSEEAKKREKELVDEYISEYGKEKVRGAGYTLSGGSQ